eukprot:2360702-Prymnesium_polylepis.1
MIMLMGLPTSCKRYGNGVSIVTAKCEFHTTTVIRGEGEGGQSVSYKSLNCSNRCDVSEIFGRTDGEPNAMKVARWVRRG